MINLQRLEKIKQPNIEGKTGSHEKYFDSMAKSPFIINYLIYYYGKILPIQIWAEELWIRGWKINTRMLQFVQTLEPKQVRQLKYLGNKFGK